MQSTKHIHEKGKYNRNINKRQDTTFSPQRQEQENAECTIRKQTKRTILDPRRQKTTTEKEG